MNKIVSTLIICTLSFSARAITFHSDVPETVKNQLLNDLDFVAQIQGSQQTPFHQKIFKSMTGSSYMQFFNTHLASVGLDDCGNPKAVACVLTYLHPNNVLWLSPNYIHFSHPQIARIMTIFHEARHTENLNNNWYHADCPVPFIDENGKDRLSLWTGAKLAGEPACDVTPFGSYGISVIMLKNIERFCINCTDKVKMDANLYSSDELNRIYKAHLKNSMINDFKNTVNNPK